MKRNGLLALAVALLLLAVAGTACAQTDAVLYIGTQDAGFEQYEVTLPDELTADALCVYYYMQDDQPLTIESIGMSWPIDEPYQWPDAQ